LPLSKEPDTALVKNFLFYTQATSILLDTDFKWVSPLPDIGTVFKVSQVSISVFGIACVNPTVFGYVGEAIVLMLSPMFLLMISTTVYVFLFFLNEFYFHHWDMNVWLFRTTYAFMWLLGVLYFPMTTTIMSAFNCVEDPVTQIEYLSSAPYIECDRKGVYGVLFGLALAVMIPFVVGVPLLFLYVAKKARKMANSNPNTWGILTKYTQCYKEEFYFWESALFVRKFAFAAIISLVPNDSPFMALGIFFVILIYILLHSWLVPFSYRSTNVLDVAADAMIIVTFLAGVLFQTPTYTEYSTSLAICVFILNVVLTLAYAIVYFKKMAKRHKRTLMKLYKNSLFSSSDDLPQEPSKPEFVPQIWNPPVEMDFKDPQETEIKLGEQRENKHSKEKSLSFLHSSQREEEDQWRTKSKSRFSSMKGGDIDSQILELVPKTEEGEVIEEPQEPEITEPLEEKEEKEEEEIEERRDDVNNL